MSESIKRFGYIEPIIVNVRGNKNIIVGGNQRFSVLQAAGVKEATYITVDLNKADEKVLNLTLNNPKIQGQFFKEIESHISEIQKHMPKADFIGLKIADLQSEIGQRGMSGNTLDDEIPKPPKKPKTRPGDLWILGDHRLLCGDSTKPADVKRLFGKEKASLFATDPPYCVDYTGTNRPGGGKDWSGDFCESKIKDAKKFWSQFLAVGLKYIRKNTAIYMWHADSRRSDVVDVCNKAGFLIHQTIIWVKPCGTMGFSFFSWQHEPCLMMWVKGSKPAYKPKRIKIGTVWPIGYIKSGDPTTPEYYTDVWELGWEGKKRAPKFGHPTIKPVEVFSIPLRLHTKAGDICYEPFCGSGSQVIAAEKLSRRCFALELKPVFCDVTIKRWELWSGKKAKRFRK